VGDDDQSIFRFQGANVENMLHYQKQYHETITTIVLENNYRSTQPILNASTLLINNNQERLINKMDGLSKNLIAALPENKNIEILPSIFAYNDPQEEMIGIAEKINQLIQTGTHPKDIAVLYKAFGKRQEFYFGIPYGGLRDLMAFITSNLSSDAIATINDNYKRKNIKFRF
jgi:DNA helicase-2/ATP-dependent DNA helicase PcrA